MNIELARVDLRREPPPMAKTVTANLTAPLLRDVAARIEEAPERLVCSGMLVSEIDEVVSAVVVVVGASARESVGDAGVLPHAETLTANGEAMNLCTSRPFPDHRAPTTFGL
jgi:hypothetical protein